MGSSVPQFDVMSRPTRLVAVLLAAIMVLAVATPAAVASQPAEIDVTVDDPTYTVTVTHNNSTVDNATVTVEPTDPANSSYSATGQTDENGTVTFDLPENETEVNITAAFENHERTVTHLLPAANASDEPTWDGEGPFGQWVTSWLHDLLNGEDNNRPFGQQVADIVTSNNPGSDHRSDKADPGPPDETGPPDHAGPNDDDNGDDENRGPPDHAKGPKDTADDDEDDEE